jgi:hypothetical protein
MLKKTLKLNNELEQEKEEFEKNQNHLIRLLKSRNKKRKAKSVDGE